MARKLGAAFALSFAIHAGVLGGAAAVKEVQKLQREREMERAKNAQLEEQDKRAELIRMKKELLVKAARAAIREGNLSLGKFILEAERIDAEENGGEFDNVAASAKYREYLSLLDKLLAGGTDLRDAIPEVLKGIQYFGVAGGTTGDLLVEGGGKCDQVSPLIASLGYDSGHGDEMFLRAYANHLAPILVEGGEEYDLMAGKESDGEGVLFPAERLVEMYASKNGIPPEGEWVAAAPARQGAGGNGHAIRAAMPGLIGRGGNDIFAYPETTDTYDGEVPLFSPVAVAARAAPGDTSNVCIRDEDGETCYDTGGRSALIADYIPFEELLNVAPFRRPLVSGDMPVMMPGPLPDFELDSASLSIKHLEKKMAKEVSGIHEEVKRLLDIAELVAHYTRAEWHFRSLGKDRIVSQIVFRENELREQAKALMSGLELEGNGWKGALGPILDDAFPYMRLRLLPFLGDAGARLLFGIYKEERGKRAIPHQCMAALLVNPGTHDEALGLFGKMDGYEKAMIAREFAVYGANIDEDDSELYRAVMAYGSLLDNYDPAKEFYEAWLHGEPEFGKLLRALREALSENGLGREWEIGFMVYFGEQVTKSRVGMPIFKDGQEAEGMAFVKELDAWLGGVDASFEEIDKLRSKVRHMLNIGRYDRMTLIGLERCEAGLEPCPE